MSKHRIIKITALAFTIAVLTVLFAINVFASSTVKVTFNVGNTNQIKYFDIGETVSIPEVNTVPEHTLYGWVDRHGNLYQAKEGVIVINDTVFMPHTALPFQA